MALQAEFATLAAENALGGGQDGRRERVQLTAQADDEYKQRFHPSLSPPDMLVNSKNSHLRNFLKSAAAQRAQRRWCNCIDAHFLR